MVVKIFDCFVSIPTASFVLLASVCKRGNTSYASSLLVSSGDTYMKITLAS